MNSLFLPRTPSLGQLQQKCSCRHYEDWQTRNAVEEVTSFLHVSDENFDCYSFNTHQLRTTLWGVFDNQDVVVSANVDEVRDENCDHHHHDHAHHHHFC